MSKKTNTNIIGLISILWMSVIIVFYFNRHPEHFESIKYFKFFGLIFSFVLIFFAWLGIDHVLKKKRESSIALNGLSIICIILLFSCLIHGFFQNAFGYNLSFQNYLHLSQNILSLLMGTLLVFGISLLIGKKTLPLILKSEDELLLLKFSFGCIIQFLGLFILGLFHLLHLWSIAVFYVILFILAYDKILATLYDLLIAPLIAPKSSKILLFACFILIFYLTINMNYFYGPFPLGYDTRNLYFNIPKLIGESHGLVQGFAPYNWSIFMSLGFLLFDSPEMTMMLSFAPSMLVSIYVIYISYKYFDIKPLIAVLLLLAFLASPAVTNHLMIELKIDFALLIFQLAILELIIIYWRDKKQSKSTINENSIFILIGLLSGFAITIKLTHAFFVFTIIILIWIIYHGKYGFLTMFAACSTVMLLLRFDDMSGLRNLNLSAGKMIYIWVLLGIVSFFMIMYKYKSTWIKTIKLSLLFVLGHIFFLGGWLLNSESFSVRDIKKNILGFEEKNNISVTDMIKKYKKKKDEELEE